MNASRRSRPLPAPPLLVFSLAALAAAAAEPDWPAWRGPSGNGIAPEPPPAATAIRSPHILWKAELGRGWSAVTISGDRLYSMGNEGNQDTVWCLDPATGKERWKHTYACPAGNYPGPRSTPVTDGDSVFSVSRQGDLFCLDARDGHVKWQKNLQKDFGARPPRWGHAGAALIVGDHIILNAGRAGIALEKRTGRTVWRNGPGVGGYSTPVLFQMKGKPYVALFVEKRLAVCEAGTGRVYGEFPWETRFNVNASDPTCANEQMFIVSGYKRGCAMVDCSKPSLRSLWEKKEPANHFGSPVLLDGHLYDVSGNAGRGRLMCLSWKTGDVSWQQDIGFGSLIAAGKTLVVLTERGELILVDADPTDYHEQARGRVLSGGKAWTAPVLCRGRLYCRNDRGELVCVAAR